MDVLSLAPDSDAEPVRTVRLYGVGQVMDARLLPLLQVRRQLLFELEPDCLLGLGARRGQYLASLDVVNDPVAL